MHFNLSIVFFLKGQEQALDLLKTLQELPINLEVLQVRIELYLYLTLVFDTTFFV